MIQEDTATLDRRQSRRIRTAILVRLWPARDGDLPDYREGQTVDLSAEGLLFRCDSLDPEFLGDLREAQHAPVDLQIQIQKGAYRVRASGHVVWMEEHDGETLLGVCFRGFRHLGKRRLDWFLKSIAPS